MRSKAIIALLLMVALLPLDALAARDEAYGVVVNVVDGDTVDINMEKGDPRIMGSIERVRMADVDSPEISTSEGLLAKDLTSAVLLNKRAFLDIDDASGNGRDSYGRLICVVYLSGVYG
ncbi:MAG: thermonuclease family protein, partial [Methanosarcinales archaeon]|nr:thermonuclease family protein [Methanosarcinales archaeon]